MHERDRKKMVVTINADTGEIEQVTDEQGVEIEKKHWPDGGIKVGTMVRHIPCGIIIHDDSPDDCCIFHYPGCTYYQIGC